VQTGQEKTSLSGLLFLPVVRQRTVSGLSGKDIKKKVPKV
jgi:hypothetical protein